jgi:hypothetical protein
LPSDPWYTADTTREEERVKRNWKEIARGSEVVAKGTEHAFLVGDH